MSTWVRRGGFPRAEYEHLPSQSCRMENGHRVVAHFDNAHGFVYVKTFGDHIRVQKVTAQQWENAVLNHNMRLVGEDAQ